MVNAGHNLMNWLLCSTEVKKNAIAHSILSNSDGTIYGQVYIAQTDQPSNPLVVSGTFIGLEYDHDVVVLSWGNLTGGCATMGGIYSPEKRQYSDVSNYPRPLGILGTVHQGKILTSPIKRLSVYGHNSIIGRGIAVLETVYLNVSSTAFEAPLNRVIQRPVACGIIARVITDEDIIDLFSDITR
ncbi:hypothetical protein AB6A40_001162 [Gnathostoma spinigerum]|uniref:Superoxide dismutase copper/zinc binding domain-containing protein n=1 Tax=Gnathostoma spinigerum TaxID=75299 RepID=A0ABD6E3J3_9BILA